MKFKDIVSQTSVQEPKTETNHLKKTCDFGFCLMNLTPSWNPWRLTEFLKQLFQQNYCQLGLKGTEWMYYKIRLSVSQHSFGRKEHDKTTQLQTQNTFHEKRRNDSKGRTKIPEVELRILHNYSKSWNLIKENPAFALLDFKTLKAKWLIWPFILFLLELNVYNWYPMPVPSLNVGSVSGL